MIRPRRLRQSATLRNLLAEVNLSVNDLVMPLFVKAGTDFANPIVSMPGQFQFSLDRLLPEVATLVELGIPAIMLFGIPAEKDATGSSALTSSGIVQQAIVAIKKHYPKLLVMADCCFCEYTDHGHCGVLTDLGGEWRVDNDATLALLAKQAVSLAEAGADIIAPSGMMDGMVSTIRAALDESGFQQTSILSYAAKYASNFYGPFREAAEGAPQFGDRKGYQMDYRRKKEAILEVGLDVEEGADMLMVKPAGAYLDVIADVKQQFSELPLAAYQVSGEYSMIKAAAEKGWLDGEQVALESLIAIKRAGADFILTYFAKEIAQKLI